MKAKWTWNNLHDYINIPADCFPREWVHDFIKRKTVVNIIKMWKFSWFCNIAIWEILYNLRNYNGQKKNVTKTLLFAWNSNMSIFFGPCKWGSFFEAFFVSLWYRQHFRRPFCQVYLRNCEHKLHHRFGQTAFRSILNTSYITGLDMCEVCTEAVHSAALWTRVTSLVWTCVKYVPKQSIP